MTLSQRFPGLGLGMVESLKRANEGRAIADLEQEVERLEERLSLARKVIAQRDAEIVRLNELLAADSSLPSPLLWGGVGGGVEGIVHNNRPAATPRQIAAQHGVNVSSVIRKLQSGKIAGAQINGSRWLAYTDQPISFRNRGR